MKRTYSKKRAQRRLRKVSVSPERSPSPERLTAQEPRKRQRIQVAVVSNSAFSLDREDATTGSEIEAIALGKVTWSEGHERPLSAKDASTPPALITPSRSKICVNSPAVPRMPSPSRSHTMLDAPVSVLGVSPSPNKSTKDLSGLFSFASTSESSASPTAHPSRNKSAPGAGIARRMLARTRTESTIASGTSFESVSAVAGPSTPRRLTKSEPEGTVDHTPMTPSQQGPLTPSKSRKEESSSAVPARPSLVQSNVRTYAGKSRSFLVALPAAQFGASSLSRQDSHSQSQPIDEDVLRTSQEDDLEITESYTDLRMRWGVDNSEDDPRPPSPVEVSPDKRKRKGKGKQLTTLPTALPNGMMNDLKSITELRSKGESRRFLDEMGYLFEGLAAENAMGVRRGSAEEVMEKLCDADFARRAKAADFVGRTWDVLRAAGAGDGDKVLDTVLAFFAALVARDAGDLVDLADKSDFATVLYKMLGSLNRHNDPLWLISCGMSDAEPRKAGMSKSEKTSLLSLHRLIWKKSGIFQEYDIISSRLLISHALATLPSSSQNVSYFPSLLKSLSAEVAPIPSRVSAYVTGLPLLPSLSSSSHIDIPSLLHTDNCLHLLDSYLLSRWSDDTEETGSPCRSSLDGQRSQGFGESLVLLCAACDVLSRDGEHHEEHSLAFRAMESALRVLINVTHDDLPWSEAVLRAPSALLTVVRLIVLAQRQRAHATVKQEDEQTDAHAEADTGHALDRLCLALGLLTNLVQVSQQAKELVRDTLFDYMCPAKRTCTLECRCPSRTSALHCLVSAYIQCCKSEAELDSVVRGHMAMLFGLLMRGSAANTRVLLRSLPGASRGQKLDALVEHAREFSAFYVAFTEKAAAAVSQQSPEDDEQQSDERLAGVDVNVERMLRDAKGESVARGVIQFLERLRMDDPLS